MTKQTKQLIVDSIHDLDVILNSNLSACDRDGLLRQIEIRLNQLNHLIID